MKDYLFLVIAAVWALSLIGTGWYANNAGRNAEKAAQTRAIEKYKQAQAQLNEELEKERAKRKVIVREKIRTIRTAGDPSGCADVDIAPDIYQRVQPRTRSD